MKADPLLPAETTLPVLIELSTTDPRLKISVEDSRIDLNALDRLSLSASSGLAAVLEKVKAGPNASPCKLVRVELRLDQMVLMQQLTLNVVERKKPTAGTQQILTIAVEKGNQPNVLLALRGGARLEDRMVAPIVLSSSPMCASINAVAMTQSLVITFAATVLSGVEEDNSEDNAEFDKEVAMIAKNGEEKEPDRSCDTLPRYYKDTWSPDRGTNARKDGTQQQQVPVTELSPIRPEIPGGDETIRYLQSVFTKITIRGVATQHVPPASCTIQLLNLRPALQKARQKELLSEVEYLTALSLISGKRFVQSSEILRKLEVQLLSLRTEPESAQQKSASHKAAKIEILIADCMSPYFQLYEKLQSLRRAVDLSVSAGNVMVPVLNGIAPSAKYSNEDIYTFLSRMHPGLIRLLLSMLGDRSESQRSATLRCMEFVVEHMGCSMGGYVSHILKAMLLTYPTATAQAGGVDSFNLSMLSVSSGAIESSPRLPLSLAHPKSREGAGMETGNVIAIGDQNGEKLLPLYNRLLEKVMSVLSSISSQILHKIFYEIILPNAYSPELGLEVRNVLLNVADKIVTICQGDLVPTSAFLNGVVKDQSASNKKISGAATSLWQTIKTKLCPNCATKARKRLVCWVAENLTALAQKVNSHPGSRETAEEDAALRLGTYIDVACILTSVAPIEAEPNPLVIPAAEEKTDFYELLSPLLYWLNFSMGTEGRMELFKQVWQCTANILASMRVAINFDVNSFIMPLIVTVNEHCRQSSPTVSMLKFLETVVKEFSPEDNDAEMRDLLVELTNNLASRVPNFPFEDIFCTLDLLLQLIFPALPPPVFANLISSLTDRYTLKTKQQQEMLQKVIAMILSRSAIIMPREGGKNFFVLALEDCFFHNRDVDLSHPTYKRDIKRAVKTHETFIQKLGFAIDLLKAMGAEHKELFAWILQKVELGNCLTELLASGHSAIRLRAFEVVEILCDFFVAHGASGAKSPKRDLSREILMSQLTMRSPEIVRRDQFLLVKLVLTVLKKSLAAPADSYLQFNSLILLDSVFQRLLPVPSFSQELLRRRQKSVPKLAKNDVLDLETIDPSKIADCPVSDAKYLHTRLLTALKAWPYVKQALGSPWSNIRSIAYGLICSMYKVSVQDYRASFRDKIKAALLPVLVSLLSSKESEAKAGGLNILGSFCGLGYDVGDNENLKEQLDFFRRNSDFVSLAIWQQAFSLQDDWDSTIKEAATVLVQFSAPKESVTHFTRVKAESKKLRLRCLAGKFGPICMAAASKLLTLNRGKDDSNSVAELLDLMGRTSDLLNNNELTGGEEMSQSEPKGTEREVMQENDSSLLEDKEENEDDESADIFFAAKYSSAQIKDIISIFKNDFRPPKTLWIEGHLSESLPPDDYFGGEPLTGDGDNNISNNKVPTGELPLETGGSSAKHCVIDILEDKLVNNLPPPAAVVKKEEKEKKKEEDTAPSVVVVPDSIDAEPYKFLPPEDDDLKQEDLGVIEVEGDEDFLGPLEESKVPVLKNTYANVKNKRPRAPKPASKKAPVQIDPLSESITRTATSLPPEPVTMVPPPREEKQITDAVALSLIAPPTAAIPSAPVYQDMDNEAMNVVTEEIVEEEENIGNEEEEAPVAQSNPSNEKRTKKKKDAKYNQSFTGSTALVRSATKGKKTRANKSFEHSAYHSTRSTAPSASRSCLKNLQISSPSDTLRFCTTLLSPHLPHSCSNKRKKVLSTRAKPSKDLAEEGPTNKHTSSHSGSMPSSPRTHSTVRGKKKPSPAKFLNTVHFNPKSKRTALKRQKASFAQTSPALAAILKSLSTSNKTPTSTSGTIHYGKPEKKSEERPRRIKKGGKVRMRKDVSVGEGQHPAYIPVQTINIRTDQINFRTVEEERHITPMRDNYVQQAKPTAADDDETINQTY